MCPSYSYLAQKYIPLLFYYANQVKMNKKGNKSPINTLIFSNSVNTSEQVASHLKNQGLAIRHHVIDNSESLKSALDERQWQIALFLNELENLNVQQGLALLSTQALPVSSIMLSDNYNEELRFTMLAKGVKDCIPSSSLDLLTLIVKREQLFIKANSELASANKEVIETSKRNELLLDSSKDAIAYVHEGMHIYTNPAYSERFDYDEDEIIVMSLMDMIAPEDTDKIKALLKKQAQSDEEVSEILKGKKADGTTFEANFILSSAIYDEEHCVQLLVREVADQSELMQKLKEASEVDQISGAMNRPAFMQHFIEAVHKSRETGIDAFLYFIEIDNFVNYRKDFGIAACDELLRGISDWLKSLINNKAAIGRISDSSFAIIVADSDSMPSDLARNITNGIQEQLFQIAGQTIKITLSIGAVTCADNDFEPTKLMVQATGVCHSVQEKGGNDFKIFNPSVDSLLSDTEKSIYDEFVLARESGHITLFYQPMMSLKGSPETMYMCYLRYQDKTGRWVLQPGIFEIFEKLGIDADIDKVTFKHCLKMLMKEKAEGKKTRLFLSLNPNTLLREDLVDWIKSMVTKSTIDPSNLVLTINNKDASSYLKKVQELRASFAEKGIRFCLSGINIGDTELIQEIGPHYITFNGDLLETLKNEGNEKVIPLINAGKHIEAKTIITRLEDASALAQVWPLGIEFAMGNYVSKPLPKLSYDFADSDF